jgi:SAM-dependent methyltransferase
VTYTQILARAPGPIRRWALHFECEITDAVGQFAGRLPKGARVLDAGSGEGQYKRFFRNQKYVGVDLGVGDANWNYRELDTISDLNALPFPDATFDAALNIVTLEHLRFPEKALAEIARVLKPGGEFLMVAPFEWEEHQQPHDYFRYTKFGLGALLEAACFREVRVTPAGGFFGLLSRRLLNSLQFFMRGAGWLFLLPAVLIFVPLSLVLPLLEPLDRERNFTLGYICIARKSSSSSVFSEHPY